MGGTSTAKGKKILTMQLETEIALAENTIQLIPSVSQNVFSFINTPSLEVNIGVGEVYKGNADGIGEPVEAALYKYGAWATI